MGSDSRCHFQLLHIFIKKLIHLVQKMHKGSCLPTKGSDAPSPSFLSIICQSRLENACNVEPVCVEHVVVCCVTCVSLKLLEVAMSTRAVEGHEARHWLIDNRLGM